MDHEFLDDSLENEDLSKLEVNNQRISILNLDDSLEQCPKVEKAFTIRVSNRNRIIRKKLSIVDKLNLDHDMPITASCIEKLEESKMIRIEPHISVPSQAQQVPYKVYSCFLLYFLKENEFRSGISETELKNFRIIFNGMLNKSEGCHEAYFGLGKLNAFVKNYSESINYFKKAIVLRPDEELYQVWLVCASDRNKYKNKNELINQRNLLKKYLQTSPRKIEYLWAYLMNFLHPQASPNGALIKKIAAKIKRIDNYFGYLAYSEVFFHENNIEKSIKILTEMISCEKNRPEAYYKLWRYYYENDQITQAEDIAAQAFIKVTNIQHSHYFIIFCISYAKTFLKLGNIRQALELLQQKYIEHPKNAIFLYQYGRFCIKSGEDTYLICGITALEECIRVCDVSIHGKVFFWLSKAYLIHDYPVKSHDYLVKSLKSLTPSENKKISEINLQMGRLSSLIERLKKIETTKNILKSDEISQKIAETHHIEGVLAFARSLWTQEKESALSFLLGYKNLISRCDYFFLMFSYLQELKDYKTLKSQTKKLIDRSKELLIPTSDWIHCHLWYSKALELSGKPEKAIFLLKCLGKIFPKYSYHELKYTKALASAETVLEIIEACSIEQQFRQSIHIVSQTYLAALASKDVPLFLEEKKDQAQVIYSSDSVVGASAVDYSLRSSMDGEEKGQNRPTIQRYIKKRAQVMEYSNIASQKFEVLLQKRNRKGFLGFSLCSDPEFLKSIAKIAYRNKICMDDGLYAIEDYLEIIEHSEKRLNAIFYKSMLFYYKRKILKAAPLMEEILPMLKKSGKTSKYEIVKEILDSRN